MNALNTAPIALFVYKRIDCLSVTINSLKSNDLAKESELYIFSDGYKNELDKEGVLEVRKYINSINGFKNIKIIESDVNVGLANSIINGVSFVLTISDSIIVLEDDLETTPNFLSFMNESLTFHFNSKDVFSVSGYSFNLGLKANYPFDNYFLNRGWSWGWATWKSKWEKVDWSVKSYNDFKKNKSMRAEFAKGGSDLNKMLDKQMNGELDSWAIRWFYHQYKIKGLTVYPTKSKVNNLGFRNDATHTTGSVNRYVPILDKSGKHAFNFITSNTIDPYFQRKFQKKMGIISRIISKLEDILLNIKKW